MVKGVAARTAAEGQGRPAYVPPARGSRSGSLTVNVVPSPGTLATWMLPDTSWSFLAGIALLFAIVEAFATRAMQHALPWFGFERRPSSLACATIKLVMAIGVLALLVLLG